MKKIQTILFFLFIALFWSCSMLEHDEERGCIFVQLNSGTILSKLNSGSSRGNVSSSVQENFTARLIVTNGSSEIHSTSKAVSENDNLTFSVAGLPVKTVVTVKMQIIGSSGTVYFEGSKDVFVLEGNTPVEIVLNKKFKLCGILYDGEKINRYYDEGEAGIIPLKDNEITFFFVPYETDLINFDPENFSSVPADEWRWELNGNKLDGGVNSVSPCSVSLTTSGLKSENTNVLTCTVKIGEESYEAVYNFTVSSEPEVVVNKKFKLCGILNDGEKINRYYDEGGVGILPLNNNEIKFFFVPDDTDLTNFDPENFSYVPADEWRWELNGKKLNYGVFSVTPRSLSTSGLESENTNVLKCTVKIGEEWYEAVYNFTVEQPVIVNLNTKFKLCGTLYNGGELQHFYNYTETSTLPLNNEITFFFVPYETDLTNFDPNNFSYVPADEWSWELNGNKLNYGDYSVNPCSVSLATPGLEYEKTNVLTCTVKIAEVWYQAVYKFTVEKPAASANYNSYAFYVENQDDYNGYISAYNVDSRFVIPGTENNIISGYKFNVTADAGKTYLYYKESANYKIMCSQNKPGMEESAASNLNLGADTLEGTTVNWLTGNGASEGQGELIGKRIAYDSVTRKYWMLGKVSTDYYMLSTDSITEEADLQHYNMTGLINAAQIESLDGEVDFAVYNNYIVLYVKPSSDTYSTKLHILKIKEGDNALEYIAYIDNVSICPLNIELTDIQAVGSDIYLLYGTAISNYNGLGNHSYGFVARLTYDSDDAAAPYKYDNSFGTVGLTANFSKETVIKMSDGYYSGSGSYNEATYFSYYGPTEEDADCSFFGPQYFAAIKDDYLYVIDDGFRKKEDSETGALANRDRLMKVSLKDKTVSVEKDGISLMAGNGSVPNIFEF
ncbi:MAG: hypothetical protein MSH22_02780 [Spirochaetia bacterium]|nr:hypothetical protein [Spirochaetia bacterium]